MKLITAEQMREIDRRTIEERGVPALQLMEAAGRAVALDVKQHFPPGSAAVLCGKGNNGGDGFVVARMLGNAGWNVHVVLVAEPEGVAREAFAKLPAAVRRFRFDEIADLGEFLASQDVIVDALLGTGTKGRPRAPYDLLIEQTNAARVPVFSIDVPSGLDPDDGTALVAVRAFRTITMGLPKIGLVSRQGPEFSGAIRVEALGFPKDLLEGVATLFETMTAQEAAQILPLRPPDGHKGTFGLLTLAAGSDSMPGAAMLAGLGALRGGCGLVRMLTPRSIRPIVAEYLPEAIHATGLHSDTRHEPLHESEWEGVLDRATAFAIGPGLGTAPGTVAFVEQVLAEVALPTVLDADALNILADHPGLLRRLTKRHVLTPHPGEAARLLERTIPEVQRDRWASARELAQRTGAVVLLKGLGSLVAEPEGNVTHIPSGNTAWARGGAGDVLTGLIGSLLAQGATPIAAARLGAFVHGMAADLYARDKSPRGALIREVADCLPLAFRELERLPIIP